MTEPSDVSDTGDIPAFSFRGTAVGVGEVIRAAHFRGELRPILGEAALAAACAEAAAEEGLEPAEESLEALSSQFRYEWDLITAEETEAWLERRRIDSDEFQNYFERCYWRDALRGRVTPGTGEFADISGEELDALTVDLFMSRALPPLAGGYVRRLVAQAQLAQPCGADQVQAERDRFFERLPVAPDRLGEWLERIGRTPAWFEAMVALEASYHAKCAELLVPERLSKAMPAARLLLTRLEMEEIEFDSMDAAREALLCVRNDGLSMEEVALEARFPYRLLGVFAEEVPEAERQILLCASAGEVLEPAATDGRILLRRLRAKVEPTLDEASVRSRIEKRALDAYFSGGRTEDVRWLVL